MANGKAGKLRLPILLLPLLVLLMPVFAGSAYADGILGSTLSSFAVLGASTVTNTGATTVDGNVGLYAGSAITGAGSISITGVYDTTDATAELGQMQLSTAITTLDGMGPGTSESELGGLSLAPGVYSAATSLDLATGATLTLDGGGNPNALWVFLAGTTLTTGSGSAVDVINSGSGAGVYWVAGSSATLGTTTSFEGNILATDSITLDTGATDGCGRVLASTGAVTMDNNTISIGCAGTYGSGTNGFSGAGSGTVTTTPEPSTFALVLSGLLAIGFLKLRKLRARPLAIRVNLV